MPAWVTLAGARSSSSLARSFHPVIVAILFVKAVGFGALAGILALTVASVGFIGKLFTEAIEEISLKQVEAVRATGAPFASVLAFGVLPQVFSRFIGFATYQLDSNLRNSTMVGIVGAGGIGGTLFAAFQRFDYDFVCAILLSIIALIMIGRGAGRPRVRAIFIDNATLGDLFRARRACAARAARWTTTDGRRRRRCRRRRARRARSGGASRRAQRLTRFAVYLVIVAAIVASARTVEVIPEFLYDAPEQVVDLLHADVADRLARTTRRACTRRSWRRSTSRRSARCWRCVLALPVGVLAAHNLVPFTPLNLFAKLILVSSRSVNSLVWALLFVGIFGPGALAGTLAIAFRSIGFVGKLFGEALEEAQPGPIEALTAAGAPWISRMTYGYWPQVKPAFWSIALFRWDINVRESAVLGLVGAGGIGMALDSALNLFQWDRVAVILIAIFAVVVIAEVVVTQVRKRVI